ncbi:MAG: GNAT family N-acetyltransferase [Pseudotabrizicola sp.]|uniref:GNAT family N-acetyltransferase n=1 Tax=Pseudotabrizicola sp. TaxID=2939647 RepID=UPI00271673CA|nr:GNAT family N-acetyltransferase [Pseudotabrizicola sp.]MDO8882364.1 GNAT family N-acetyltransferase [Pseudotabrizicola sp.]MDP2082307.1 GNAT family N-acetyltransferase [Pseudotabrizicola sp.]MDZ7574367.1 GNAT family N-acetyltransferase [Pseudotabrizicola sp.]
MTPHEAQAPYDWSVILRLIQTEFASMEGRIDPPSSMHALTSDAIAGQAQTGEVWVIGAPPVACLFLTVKPQALYLGKLAVAGSRRGRGLARVLIDTAAARARALGLPILELKTRIELVENHAAFRAMGFAEVGRGSHPGYDRPTTLIFQRAV